MTKIEQLIKVIRQEPYVYIQPHDFPDHDAVASAYGLQDLLNHFNISSRLVYEGEISRNSLHRMIETFNIDICHISKYNMKKNDKVIIVDGCKHNNNVTDLIGDEVGVIDHHEVSAPYDVPFYDIRSSYGACSSIIFSYFRELDIPISRDVASALMVGIVMDTMHFVRLVSHEDLDAYMSLYPVGNVPFVNTVVRNDVSIPDLKYYRYAIDNLKVFENFGFVYFPEGCIVNLLGIISDFILALDEVDFVVLCALNEEKINLSVRSEDPDWNAAEVIRNFLAGIGLGGGHADMAGGVIKDTSSMDEKKIYTAFKNILFP